jgi:hypothetical protein
VYVCLQLEGIVAENLSRLLMGADSKKSAWEPMQMEYLGNAAQLVQGGGGKLSTAGGDPGEGRKQKGQGNT